MALLDALKRMAGRHEPAPETPPSASAPKPETFIVPEIKAQELLELQRNGVVSAPVLLDCREQFERRYAYIPGSMHIVMREIPARLGELPIGADLVVYCAHGNRSYDVAGWLIGQGFEARSLKGGIVEWQRQGGAVTSEVPAKG